MSDTLGTKIQVDKSAAKANSMIKVLRKTLVSRDAYIWKQMYTTYVRPHLEYAIQAWRPHRLGEINTLEKVQRRATKVPTQLRDMTYVDRCLKLKLTTLEERRARGDLIKIFKIQKVLDTVEWHSSLQVGPPGSGHRGHIRPELVKDCLTRRNAFRNRVARMRNKLPDSVIDAPSVNSFKKRIDDQRTGCS